MGNFNIKVEVPIDKFYRECSKHDHCSECPIDHTCTIVTNSLQKTIDLFRRLDFKVRPFGYLVLFERLSKR